MTKSCEFFVQLTYIVGTDTPRQYADCIHAAWARADLEIDKASVVPRQKRMTDTGVGLLLTIQRATCIGISDDAIRGRGMAEETWLDEQRLIQGLRARDPISLEALINQYSRELFYFARLILAGAGSVQDAE